MSEKITSESRQTIEQQIAEQQVAEREKKSAVRKKIRNKRLSGFALLLLILAVLSAVYWFFFVRNFEETDDAYVNGNKVAVSAQVSGGVVRIFYDNMDLVHKGDVLVALDSTDAQLSLNKAKSILANAVRQIDQLQASGQQLQALLDAKKVALTQAQADLERREQLGKSGAIDKESLQHARNAEAAAKAEVEAAEYQLKANRALLQNTTLAEQPEVKQAASAVRQAWLDLQRTQVISPVDGYIAQRRVQVGEKVASGSPLMAVIPTDQLWIDANFKETQLRDMRIGQTVKVTFDLYGDDIKFNGKVVGIEMGTGSAFALLPTQNATGNWIKVVQRVPVRIVLDQQQTQKYPLRIGLSATVKVNTADQSGSVLVQEKRAEPLYSTDVLQYDLTPINQEIDRIIQDNYR
jgi:membrane fusion protein (multidrug efflux system)